jgi:hypothetical protein
VNLVPRGSRSPDAPPTPLAVPLAWSPSPPLQGIGALVRYAMRVLPPGEYSRKGSHRPGAVKSYCLNDFRMGSTVHSVQLFAQNARALSWAMSPLKKRYAQSCGQNTEGPVGLLQRLSHGLRTSHSSAARTSPNLMLTPIPFYGSLFGAIRESIIFDDLNRIA